MSLLRRVLGERAGPQAIGLLAPPGPRTVVIVRPRALAWDLLVLRADALAIREVEPSEAETIVQVLADVLEPVASGELGRTEVQPTGEGFVVRADLGRFRLLACLRVPGEAYRPVLFASLDEANHAAACIAAALCPPPEGQHELYFNTRHFRR